MGDERHQRPRRVHRQHQGVPPPRLISPARKGSPGGDGIPGGESADRGAARHKGGQDRRQLRNAPACGDDRAKGLGQGRCDGRVAGLAAQQSQRGIPPPGDQLRHGQLRVPGRGCLRERARLLLHLDQEPSQGGAPPGLAGPHIPSPGEAAEDGRGPGEDDVPRQVHARDRRFGLRFLGEYSSQER